MRSLVRFLLVFMALRVLAPPGVCLCKLGMPLLRLVAGALHSPQGPARSDDRDERPGCCVCQLPAGVQAKPVAPPPPPSLRPEASAVFIPVPALMRSARDGVFLRPPGRAAHLGAVPLLI